MRSDQFDYELPEDAIAQAAIEPRHDSRLLDTRDMTEHRFLDLPELLRDGDLVVVNRTKVRHSRLYGTKEDTGGRVELLMLGENEDGTWQALARPAKRLRSGHKIVLDNGAAVRVVSEPKDGTVSLEFDAPDVETLLREFGELPLPPYFKGRLADHGRYQTVFADSMGSAAAPTAGLHFTDEVLSGLKRRGIGIAKVDLEVGLDTFRPIAVDDISDHEIHTETCELPPATARAIFDTRELGGRVIAVGTTVVRTLESFASPEGTVTAGVQTTDLFLRPGSEFKVTDLMVTNFHVPRSSLIVLLAAFMGDRWREVYRHALERGYRFLSFGDAMLVERQEA